MADTAKQSSHRACVFCRATDQKITKDHVWPRWLREHVDGGKGPPKGHARIHRTRDGRTVGLDAWSAIPLDWQVAAPCERCNSGWMSDIENAAKPHLIPMLQNRPTTLDAAAQDALARWATLRMMVLLHGHPPERRQAIPPERYARFCASQEPPTGAQVWMGRVNGAGGWPTEYHHVETYISIQGWPEPTSPNGYLAAFSVGYAAFVYWGHEYQGLVVHDLVGLDPYLVPIWPIHPGSVRWPPRGLIGAEGLGAILRSFPIT